MSDRDLSEAQAVLDREQVAFLGAEPGKERMSAWFNACLNSACGPIEGRYGDVAVVTLLGMWVETAKMKAERR